MSQPFQFLRSTVSVLIVAMFLVGCTPNEHAPADQLPPGETETTATLAAVTGAEYSETEFARLLLADDQKEFLLPNGNFIIISKNDSLPDQVLTIYTAELSDFSDSSSADRGNRLLDLTTEVSRRTNKDAVTVWRNLNAHNDPDSGWHWLITYRDPNNRFTLIHLEQRIPDRATAIRKAEEFISTQESPELWVIIAAEAR